MKREEEKKENGREKVLLKRFRTSFYHNTSLYSEIKKASGFVPWGTPWSWAGCFRPTS